MSSSAKNTLRGFVRSGKKKRSTYGSLRANTTYTLRGKALTDYKNLSHLLHTVPDSIVHLLKVPNESVQECLKHAQKNFPKKSAEEQYSIATKDAENDWLASNLIHFFEECAEIYDQGEDFHERLSNEDGYEAVIEEYKSYKQGFPDYNTGFPPTVKKDDYVIPSLHGKAKPAKTGQLYAHHSIAWLETVVESHEMFPENERAGWPPHTYQLMKDIATTIFRLYVIIFTELWPVYVESSESLANDIRVLFKHFYFFVKCFKLVDKPERQVLHDHALANSIDLAGLDKEYRKQWDELQALEKNK